jgi:hypothetical protein
MSVRRIKAGTTDVSVTLRIVDSTDGTPETGVVFNTAGIDLWYRRELAASVDITEATLAALTTAHADGGFLHINDGWYRLDLPDAACATGVAGVQIGGTVTGMVVFAPYIELPVNIAEDVFTRVGAPAGASVSADIAAVKVDTAAILVDTGTTLDGRIPAALVGGRMDASVGAMAANVLTATAIAADAITDAKVASDVTIASVTGAVGSVTGNVGGNVTGSVGSVATGGIVAGSFAADAITAAKIAADVTTELQSGLATAANLATVAGYIDTEIGTIITDIAAVKADTAAILTDTAEIGAAGAGLTALATQTSVNDLPTNAELATALGTADDAVLAQVALVKAKTDSLTFTVAGKVDANTLAMNGTTVIGAGTALDKWRA